MLEVLREELTVNKIASKYELGLVTISWWKTEFLERASSVFKKKASETEKVKKEYVAKQERLEKLVVNLQLRSTGSKKYSLKRICRVAQRHGGTGVCSDDNNQTSDGTLVGELN